MQHRFSALARQDLRSILKFIAKDNVARAEALVDRIEAQVQRVAAHPHAYRLRPELGRDLRICPFERYPIVFRVENEALVLVLRVLHSAMDIGGQLEP